MRRLLILMMIVLLPLRGWAGDLMSVHMVTGGLSSKAAAAMPPGCPMHAQTGQSHTAQDADGQDHGEMKNCASCDLCIPMAELAQARFDGTTFAKHVQPQTSGPDLVSASLTPTVKPPIF
ncbi:MAG: hypothetical protein EOP38_00145 [Rubrivivax sp.]|nr:MAG: hypothetical protein EOP38_00145 [Rubrivivax sp.]